MKFSPLPNSRFFPWNRDFFRFFTISAAFAQKTANRIKRLPANSRRWPNGNLCLPKRELNPPNRELRELIAKMSFTTTKPLIKIKKFELGEAYPVTWPFVRPTSGAASCEDFMKDASGVDQRKSKAIGSIAKNVRARQCRRARFAHSPIPTIMLQRSEAGSSS